jgi:hypothetical protein
MRLGDATHSPSSATVRVWCSWDEAVEVCAALALAERVLDHLGRPLEALGARRAFELMERSLAVPSYSADPPATADSSALPSSSPESKVRASELTQ